jgi:transcriptional regulator with XRE-family HTH domain
VQLARKLGLYVNTVANYERGRRVIPQVVAVAVRCLANHARR